MVSRVKTWVAAETLTASDLNAEFNNVVNSLKTATADHIDLTDVYAWSGAHSWSAATTHTNTLTVGVNDAGHDVKFFGDTNGAYCLFDASADDLKLVGAAGLTVAGTSALTVTTASTITASGVLSVDDTTDSTSTTTGSIHTDGGLGVVKDAYFGDDVTVNGAIATTDANAANTANTGRLSFEGSNVTQLGAWGADASTAGILKFTTRSSDSSVNNTGIVIDGSGDVAIGTTTPAGALSVYGISRFSRQDSTPTGTANTVMNDAVFGSIETASTGITILGTGQLGIAFGDAASTEIGQIRYQHSTDAMEFRTNGVEAMRIDSDQKIFTGGETANTFARDGSLTLQGGGDAYSILFFKMDNCNHGVTGVDEADTYGSIGPVGSQTGGLMIRGLKETGQSKDAVVIQGILDESAGDTTKGTGAVGCVTIRSYLESSNSYGTMGADENLLVIGNSSTTRFIFDAEGSAHADVEWTTYDTHDDIQMIRDIEAVMVPNLFGDAVKYREDDLVKYGLFGKDSIRQESNGKTRGMMNTSKMLMLHHGTLKKIADRQDGYEDRLASVQLQLNEANSKLARLEMN
jgi:hypothetical protein